LNWGLRTLGASHFVKSLVKPHPNPLPFDKLRASLGKEREQDW